MNELLKEQKKIQFCWAGASHQNGAEEHAINMVVTMARNMLIHAALRFPVDTFYNGLWTMAMDYDVSVYHQIPGMQSRLSDIEIWPRSRFEPVSETLSNCHAWVCPT